MLGRNDGYAVPALEAEGVVDAPRQGLVPTQLRGHVAEQCGELHVSPAQQRGGTLRLRAAHKVVDGPCLLDDRAETRLLREVAGRLRHFDGLVERAVVLRVDVRGQIRVPHVMVRELHHVDDPAPGGHPGYGELCHDLAGDHQRRGDLTRRGHLGHLYLEGRFPGQEPHGRDELDALRGGVERPGLRRPGMAHGDARHLVQDTARLSQERGRRDG